MKDASSSSADPLWQADRQHVLHPFEHFDSFEREGSLMIESGEGLYIRDRQGRQYLDAVGGLWCTNIGLGRQEMADVIGRQVLKLAYANPFVDMGNAPAAELAALLAKLAPGSIDHAMFTTGGSTAVDTAARFIHFYQYCRGSKKRHFIAHRQGYHGSTYLSASLTGKDRIPEFDYKTDTIHLVSAPNFYRAEAGMTESQFCDRLVEELEATILRIGPDNVAGFFAEPILGAGGVIVPPLGYNRLTRELCRKYDIIYVADEVVTAFGRVGHWFASKGEFDVEPDIITCAKGLTSGYLPLGAMLYSREMHEVVSQGDPNRFFGHGFTYSGHPVCCAAGLKTLEILERENLIGNVRDVGIYFEQRLAELADLPIVGNVRGKKLMMCVEFVADQRTRSLFPDEVNVGKRISDHCEELGLIVRSIVHLNIMSPAFTITREQVDFIVDTLRRGIEATMKDLRHDGIWLG